MELTQLANLGEFFGGAAVVGSLIYVGMQVRAQAREIRLTSLHTHTLSYANFLDSLIENRELREVYLKGVSDFESLEGQQHLLLVAFWGKQFRFHESAFHQWRAGRLDEDTWGTFNRATSELVGYPGLQAWWRTRAHWFSESFQGHIGTLIDQAEGLPIYPVERSKGRQP